MKIQILSKNNEYGFNVVSDTGKKLFSSPVQYFLSTDVSPSYQYAWEAYRDARNLIRNKSYHLGSETVREDSSVTNNPMTTTQFSDVSAEQMLVDHYMNVLDGIKEKAKAGRKDKKYGKKVYQEIKLVMKEVEMIAGKLTDNEDKLKMRKILGKYKALAKKYFPNEVKKDEYEARQQLAKDSLPPPDLPSQEEVQQLNANPSSGMTPLMGRNNLTFKSSALINSENEKPLDVKQEIMEEYSSRICQSIQDKHRGAYCHYDAPEDDELMVIENEEPILKIRINKYFNIDSIVPVGKLHRIYPLHSTMFYQKYWKPIVESIQHFCTTNPPILFVVEGNMLPDVGEHQTLKGWNIEEKKWDNIDVGTAGNAETWMISSSSPVKTAAMKSSRYTEQDYINAIVECIDPQLETIFGRTGSVVQVIPGIDFIEIDVNFGRGLEVIRLTEKQVKIVPV